MRKIKPTEHAVSQAIKKSQQAISIFTSTILQLQQANEELDLARDKDLDQIELINKNIVDANIQESQNLELIAKINAIIGGK